MKSKIKFLIMFILIYFIFINFSNASLLNPKGYISFQQEQIIFYSFFSMLIIVIPVIFMVIFFTYKYSKNTINSNYKPNWNHSTKIEFIIWLVPICIVLFLSIISWNSTHRLEPTNPIISTISPLRIDVISLNKKWLFIYPEHKLAVFNQLVLPNNTPIFFRVTSNSLMNSFFIPSLGSQIYSMAGMINKLNLIANESGIYKGFSANYSGSGFSNMKFNTIVTPDYKSFKLWINNIKNQVVILENKSELEFISINLFNGKIHYFNDVNIDLFDSIVNNFHHTTKL